MTDDDLQSRLQRGLDQFRDEVELAQAQQVCVICKRPPQLRTEAEVREYRISGVCGPCWDKMFADEEE